MSPPIEGRMMAQPVCIEIVAESQDSNRGTIRMRKKRNKEESEKRERREKRRKQTKMTVKTNRLTEEP